MARSKSRRGHNPGQQVMASFFVNWLAPYGEATRDRYRWCVRSFLKWSGKSLLEVSEADIFGYRDHMKERGLSTATRSQHIAALRSLFRYLHQEGVIDSNPTRRIKPPRATAYRIRSLTREQLVGLMNLPDGSLKGLRDRSILHMMGYHGVRRGTISRMRVEDLEYRAARVFLRLHLKGDREEEIELDPDVLEVMEAWMAASGTETGHMFTSLSNHRNGHGLSGVAIWRIVKEYANLALPGLRVYPHMLRHTYAALKRQHGADDLSLSNDLHHRSLATTQVYAGAIDKYLNSHRQSLGEIIRGDG